MSKAKRANEKRTEFLTMVVTPPERKRIEKAAAKEERSVSEYARRAALKQVTRSEVEDE